MFESTKTAVIPHHVTKQPTTPISMAAPQVEPEPSLHTWQRIWTLKRRRSSSLTSRPTWWTRGARAAASFKASPALRKPERERDGNVITVFVIIQSGNMTVAVHVQLIQRKTVQILILRRRKLLTSERRSGERGSSRTEVGQQGPWWSKRLHLQLVPTQLLPSSIISITSRTPWTRHL